MVGPCATASLYRDKRSTRAGSATSSEDARDDEEDEGGVGCTGTMSNPAAVAGEGAPLATPLRGGLDDTTT